MPYHPNYINDDIKYAFNEKELLVEMQKYIDSTYNAHYSQNQYQSFIIQAIIQL